MGDWGEAKIGSVSWRTLAVTVLVPLCIWLGTQAWASHTDHDQGQDVRLDAHDVDIKQLRERDGQLSEVLGRLDENVQMLLRAEGLNPRVATRGTTRKPAPRD